MDLKAPVHYRGTDLNTTHRTAGAGISGLQLNSVDFSNVGGVGYTEKRSIGDGRDASDVYTDGRRIDLRGQVYGQSRAEVYDTVRTLAELFNPHSAFDDDPAAQGFLPLTFSEPTADVTFEDNAMDLMLFARPAAQAQFQIVRDLLGGSETKGGALLYSAVLEAKDPRRYVVDPVAVPMTGTVLASGPLVNRGALPSPPRIHLHIPSTLGAGSVTFTLNGQAIVITVPDEAVTQEITYDVAERLLWVTKSGIRTLRMSLLVSDHPVVLPGANTFAWTSTISLPAGADPDDLSDWSTFLFYEPFA